MNILKFLIIFVLVIPKPTYDIPIQCLLHEPSVIAQEGNPGHKEPPPDWSCAQEKGTPADHACTCHRECKDEQNIDENGEATEGTHTRVVEDAKCKSYCFQKHCTCPIHNCD